ncbi:MAG TPA: hypothetical protein VMN57_15380 [Anaerolineales bacterium]|nr:hypothetical protein [Anaerolineales bacterium]
MKKHLAGICAAAGALVFFLHARYYALTQVSVLDEGAYLIKGLMFVRGDYAPFQDYGPLTNHMPLSFLVHGAVQALFGPGLREGRYFILAVGLLLAVGLWTLVRERCTPGWAALAVWLLAINPATARFYSLATSQALIACLLIWTLALALPNRSGGALPLWRTTAAAALAGSMMLVRLNLAPVFFLLVPFIFWVHGRRAGWSALGAGVLVIALGHAFFWPGILKIWAYWLPDALTPFLDPWRQPAAARFWDPQVTFSNRFYSFLEGLRLHFLSVMGLVLALFSLSHRGGEPADRRSLAFAAGLYTLLLFEHMAASLALTYCVYCFSVYIAFFAPLGLYLLAASLPAITGDWSTRQRAAAAVLVILFAILIGLGAHDRIGDGLARLRVPRLRSWLAGDPAPGLPLWDVLEHRFGLAYTTTRRVLPAAAGLIGGLTVAGLAAGLRSRLDRIGAGVLHLFLAAGLLLTPTAVLGDGYRTYDCGQDALTALEQTGAELAGLIPPGNAVYWRGGDSASPLLYLREPVLYLPQINGDYTIFDHPDADALLKFGLWSEALSERWLGEADFILVESAGFVDPLRSSVEAAGLVLSAETSAPYPCRPGSAILVFTRPLASTPEFTRPQDFGKR